MIDMTKTIGPYTSITKDVTRTYENGRTIRFAIYGMYNAHGLLGPEHNGVVILDDDEKLVICDKIERADSGYFGPTQRQRDAFEMLTAYSWSSLAKFVATHPRTRRKLED